MVLVKLLAIDLGASSGRLMQAIYDGISLQLSEVHRFKNESVNINDGLYWDILHLFQEIKVGIKKASEDDIPIQSISADTWGVDYAYLDKQGDLLYNPHCYRDNRMSQYEDIFYQLLAKEELFKETGVQPSSINSVLQIFSDLQEKPHLRDIVKKIIFMPDLINYLLSDTLSNEYTICSTSGLLNAHTQDWSSRVFDALGIPNEWFQPVVKQGQLLRKLSPRITQELKITPFNVIAGASHDTAAATLAIPYTQIAGAAFISCGTWSLIGCEVKEPILTASAYEAGLTNEGCFDGHYRLLKNTTGLWIIQELKRDWSLKSEDISFAEMVTMAKEIENNHIFINPNDVVFASPNNMEEKLFDYCKRTGQSLPDSKGHIIRIVLESLAFAYRYTIEQLESVIGERIHTIHMVGGGIQNQLLCQLTADFSKRKVVTGPVEASALGNVIAQLMAQGYLKDRQEAVAIIKASESTMEYMANEVSDLESKYQQFKKIMRAGD
ncbi:rhamnulokinase [Aerococcaceae bacterium NML160702]|nr:rhamnulokinase [Aerococcaceae bacterium NML160702]